MVRRIGTALLGLWVGLVGGCTEPECADSCAEAQEQSCPFVAGDCEQFCAAMRAVADRTECAAQADAYEDCLTSLVVCGASQRCVAEQQAYEQCVAPYCGLPGVEQPPDPDCVALEQALHAGGQAP